MRQLILRTMVLLLPLLLAAQAQAQPITVVLDNKFQAMKIPLDKEFKLADDFKNDAETSGFILRLSHAKPIAVPKMQRFVGGPKSWNDAAVRYPFKLTYRKDGKATEQAIAKGMISGTASPLKVKDAFAVNPTYELRFTTLDELAKEAAEKVVTLGGVHGQLRMNLIPLVGTPDPFYIGGVQSEIRRTKMEVTVVVPLKNRLPVRVSGQLSCSQAKNERFKFELNPGEAKSIRIPVDPALLKGKASVSLDNLVLEPPGAK